jgi:hypothetical protein
MVIARTACLTWCLAPALRNNEAELVATYGSFHQTNDHFTFGSHTERFAYYVGLNGIAVILGWRPRRPPSFMTAATASVVSVL